MFDKWVKNCEENGLEIWRLESSGETELIMTKESYRQGSTEYYRDPVYHIWKGNKWLLTTLNYREALETWRDVAAISGR